MKRLLSFCVAMILCVGILIYVSADINEGHGPGYEVSEESSHGSEGHEEEAHEADSQEDMSEEEAHK